MRMQTKKTKGARQPALMTWMGALGLFFAPFVVLQVDGAPIYGAQGVYALVALAAVAGLVAYLSAPPARAGDVLILGDSWLANRLRSELSVPGGAGDGRVETHTHVLDPRAVEKGAQQLQQLILSGEISDVVVADRSIGMRQDVSALLIECKFHGVTISRAPEFYEGLHKKVWLEALRPEAFVYSEALHVSRRYLFMKRVLDLCCAAVVLALAWPIMLLIALAIKLETPGPAVHSQERVGRFAKPFIMYKFRSMRVDAEKDGPMWASANDDRATRVGRFLRRTHLDELPQVFNVFKNEISFVGPRPEREVFIRTLKKQIPYYRIRAYIQPGITGWAQVKVSYGDSVETSTEKLRYDLYYAKHASLTFDLKILFQTVWHSVLGRGR